MDTPTSPPDASPTSTLSAWIGNASEFPVLRHWDFYNHAGVSPLPRVVADAMRNYCNRSEQTGYLDQPWHKDIQALRSLAAGLIHAEADEIAFVKNTCEGISTVANGIDWHAGDRIVTTGVEYPANMYPWMDVAKRFGVELVLVAEETGPDGARRVPIEKILAAADDSRTRLLALSHVEFASGQRHDLARIGEFSRDNGMYFCVDAIQSLGVFPVDVAAMKIDFLSAGGHKWMLGTEGTAILYCRRELTENLRPLTVGWSSMVHARPDDYGTYDFTLRSDARRFEYGSNNLIGMLGMKAALDLLSSAGIDAVAARIKLITDRLIAGLRAKGYQIFSPRNVGEESGIVSFVSPRGGHEALQKTLRVDHHIEMALREGRLRCSPHFYNTEQQIDRLIDLLPGH